MNTKRTAALFAAPALAALLLTGCSGGGSGLSDKEACDQVKSTMEDAGFASGSFDPSKGMAKIKEIGTKVSEVAEKTESEDFKSTLNDLGDVFTQLGDVVGEDGKPDMSKMSQMTDMSTKLQGSISKLAEVCGS